VPGRLSSWFFAGLACSGAPLGCSAVAVMVEPAGLSNSWPGPPRRWPRGHPAGYSGVLLFRPAEGGADFSGKGRCFFLPHLAWGPPARGRIGRALPPRPANRPSIPLLVCIALGSAFPSISWRPSASCSVARSWVSAHGPVFRRSFFWGGVFHRRTRMHSGRGAGGPSLPLTHWPPGRGWPALGRRGGRGPVFGRLVLLPEARSVAVSARSWPRGAWAPLAGPLALGEKSSWGIPRAAR